MQPRSQGLTSLPPLPFSSTTKEAEKRDPGNVVVKCGAKIATFRLHTASLLQAMRSTSYASPHKARCPAVIVGFFTAVIGLCLSLLLLPRKSPVV